MESKELEIRIAEQFDGEPVNAFELGYFLYYFRAAYVASLVATPEEAFAEGEAYAEDIDYIKAHSSSMLLSLGEDVSKLWFHQLPEELELEFLSISKQSPLKFVTKAAGISLSALTFAVILSGGKANIYTGAFELPPLAHGIRELKNAFGQNQPDVLLSERTIKKANKTKPKK